MPLANNSNPTSSVAFFSDKRVPVDGTSVAVAKRQGSGALFKHVASIDVLTRLVGNHFRFPIAAMEVVVLNNRCRYQLRDVTCSDANRLATIFPQLGAGSKMVMVNLVSTGFLGHPDNQRRAFVFLSGEITMVDSIIGSVDAQPTRLFAGLFEIWRFFENAIGHPAVFCQSFLVAAELKNIVNAVAVTKYESRHDDVGSRNPEIGFASENHPAVGLGYDSNRIVLSAREAIKLEADIFPNAISQDNRIARFGFFANRIQFRLGCDPILVGYRILSGHDETKEAQCRNKQICLH